MGNFFRGIIRASSFFRKEIFEILRQPRLVATLVLGPFLILFIFGIGYHDQPRSLRTLFVVQPNSAISNQDIQQYGKSVDLLIIYAGVTDNQNEALDRLHVEKSTWSSWCPGMPLAPSRTISRPFSPCITSRSILHR